MFKLQFLHSFRVLVHSSSLSKYCIFRINVRIGELYPRQSGDICEELGVTVLCTAHHSTAQPGHSYTQGDIKISGCIAIHEGPLSCSANICTYCHRYTDISVGICY